MNMILALASLMAVANAQWDDDSSGGGCPSNLNDIYNVAKRDSQGRKPDGRCYSHVADYIDATGFGGIRKNGFNNAIPSSYWAEAHDFADYLNKGNNAQKLGISKRSCSNPYTCNLPKGAIIVVRAGTVGTGHPTAGDIAIVGGNGKFYNGGEMGYGGSASAFGCTGSGPCVIGAYVPARCPGRRLRGAEEGDDYAADDYAADDYADDMIYGDDDTDTLFDDYDAESTLKMEFLDLMEAHNGDDDVAGCDSKKQKKCFTELDQKGKKCKNCDCAKKVVKGWQGCLKKSGCYTKDVCQKVVKKASQYCSGMPKC